VDSLVHEISKHADRAPSHRQIGRRQPGEIGGIGPVDPNPEANTSDRYQTGVSRSRCPAHQRTGLLPCRAGNWYLLRPLTWGSNRLIDNRQMRAARACGLPIRRRPRMVSGVGAGVADATVMQLRLVSRGGFVFSCHPRSRARRTSSRVLRLARLLIKVQHQGVSRLLHARRACFRSARSGRLIRAAV
jgi:hypothetical protein